MDFLKNIEILEGKNFPTWEKKLMFILAKDGLWGFVSGAEILSDEATKETKARFERSCEKAKAIMGLTVSNDLIHIVAEAQTPREAYCKLKDMFEPKVTSNRLSLLKKLLYTNVDDSASVMDHLSKMKNLFSNLKAINEKVDEDILILSILHSLPSRFDGLIQMLESNMENLTYDVIYSRVQMKEMRVSDRALVKNKPRESLAFRLNHLKSQNR